MHQLPPSASHNWVVVSGDSRVLWGADVVGIMALLFQGDCKPREGRGTLTPLPLLTLTRLSLTRKGRQGFKLDRRGAVLTSVIELRINGHITNWNHSVPRGPGTQIKAHQGEGFV